MPPTSDKKRKAEPIPAETASALANPPSLPPAPAPPPPSSKSRPKRSRNKPEKKQEPQTTSRFHCDYCARDLSSAIRARCTVCPDYDSCLDCFSVGAALKPHEASHSYRLIEVVQTPVFQVGWSAEEEEKMLEGLELYGVGNWEQVAKLIRSKSPEETESHFMKVYLQSNNPPLPDPSKMVPADKGEKKGEDEVDPKMLRVMHKHQQEDAAGWMEKRGDFVYEWDNEAEELIGDMEITEIDTKASKDLKATILEIYASKLDERDRRKKFVLERGLTDFKAYIASEKKRSKDEKEIRDSLKVFHRFLPPPEMEKFIQGLLEEKKLRATIQTYREARANGAKTMDDLNRYLAAKKMKTKPMTADAEVQSQNIVLPASKRRRLHGDSSGNDTLSNGTNGVATPAPAPPPMEPKDKKSVILGDIDIEQMAGAELMSGTELNLCSNLKLTPHQYLIVKGTMIRESARSGCLRKKDAKAIVRLDPTKVFKLYDYFQACGWIKSCNSTSGNARHPSSNPSQQNGTKP